MTCTCGHAKADHDNDSDPIDWPCRQCVCSNFDEADDD